MSEHNQPTPSGKLENRWRHRVSLTANLYLDIETDSSDTPDRELERLTIEAVRRASSGAPDLPLEEVNIDVGKLLNGCLYPEPSLEDGLENFGLEDSQPLKSNDDEE